MLMALTVALALGVPLQAGKVQGAAKTGQSFYDFTVKDIDGKDVKLDKYKGQVCLIVNMASK